MKLHTLLPAILVSLVLALAGSQEAQGQEEGVVHGQLANGTTQGSKPGPQPIRLLVYQGNAERERRDGTTDEEGRFRFEGLLTSPGYTYLVAVDYAGATYFSEPLSLGAESTKWVEVRVYEATQEPDAISVESVALALIKADGERGSLTLLEAHTFDNRSNMTYVQNLATAGGGPPFLRFSLPAGAFDLTLAHGFSSTNPLVTERGFAADGALPPGKSDLMFAYRVPYTSSQYFLLKELLGPTPLFTLLVPDDGIRVESSSLTPQPATEWEGQPFQVFRATDVPAKGQLAIELFGLPQGAGSRSQQIQNALKLGAPLLMLVVGAAVWGYSGLGRKSAAGRDGAALEEEKGRLLRTMADLDDTYERGEVPEEEYIARRQETRRQLTVVLHQLQQERSREP